jgi:hypothetical protein
MTHSTYKSQSFLFAAFACFNHFEREIQLHINFEQQSLETTTKKLNPLFYAQLGANEVIAIE